MHTLKIVQVGNSLGVVLPKEALAELRAAKGDVLYLTSAPDGMRLTPYSPKFAAQMAVAEDVVRRRRNALRVLAD
jgi:putative addiction module antidote